MLGSDVGRILLWSLPISAFTTLVAYFAAKALTRRRYSMSEEIRAEVEVPSKNLQDAVGAIAGSETSRRPPVDMQPRSARI